MMGSDARDMMGLPSSGPSKKQGAPKPSKARGRGPIGLAREVMDLNFEGAPPISIVAPRFKDKPKLPFKPRRWEQTPFMNSARKDGLVLHHWKREGDTIPTSGLPATPADSNAASEMDLDDRASSGIEDSRAAKWNIKLERPQYSDDEYSNCLEDDDWSLEETQYLVDLATEYDLRWVVVGDRYDYKPPVPLQTGSSDAMDVDQPAPQPKTRTMQDLKARYYAVAAKSMALRTPLSSMNPSEFDMHEKMTKFNPKRETIRKEYAEKLFLRTQEEAHEEELLLKELSRIVINQEKLYQERKNLYERLEAPRPINPAAAQASTMIYSSSQGLYQLMQNMLSSQRQRETERREKRRSALGIDTENANSQTTGDHRGQRHSLGSASASQDRRQPHPTPQHRPLSHAERVKFGVSYPQERLTSGVQFRHERVLKASQAKSAVQTTRINDALSELGIPPRLLMPTNKVVTEYERLVEGVKQLVEIRKLREKVDGEIKVWEAQRNLANGDGTGDVTDQGATKTEDVDAEGDIEDEEPRTKEEEKPYSDDDNDAQRSEDGEEDEERDETAANRSLAADSEDRDQNDSDEVEEMVDQRVEEDDEDDDGSEDDHDPEQANQNEESDGEENDEPSDGVRGGEEGEDGESGGEPEVPSDEEASAPGRSIRKRSASVISTVSNQSSKRQRR